MIVGLVQDHEGEMEEQILMSICWSSSLLTKENSSVRQAWLMIQRRGNDFYCQLSIVFPCAPEVIGVTRENSSVDGRVIDDPKEEEVEWFVLYPLYPGPLLVDGTGVTRDYSSVDDRVVDDPKEREGEWFWSIIYYAPLLANVIGVSRQQRF